ncbi:hypothetical protein D3C75_881190 [compost metagenome]
MCIRVVRPNSLAVYFIFASVDGPLFQKHIFAFTVPPDPLRLMEYVFADLFHSVIVLRVPIMPFNHLTGCTLFIKSERRRQGLLRTGRHMKENSAFLASHMYDLVPLLHTPGYTVIADCKHPSFFRLRS